MKKINLKSTQIQNNFRLFRIKVPNDKLLEVKDLVMSKMNEYLEENEGFLLILFLTINGIENLLMLK